MSSSNPNNNNLSFSQQKEASALKLLLEQKFEGITLDNGAMQKLALTHYHMMVSVLKKAFEKTKMEGNATVTSAQIDRVLDQSIPQHGALVNEAIGFICNKSPYPPDFYEDDDILLKVMEDLNQ